MALVNKIVIELEGLAPTVFAGKILREMGAKVILVTEKAPRGIEPSKNSLFYPCCNVRHNGKEWRILNLKEECGKEALRKLIKEADILLDPYRPGVLERLGIKPLEINARLIFTRVTGYGQASNEAGHDLNYISRSGLLPGFGEKGFKPQFPGNILADFAAGGYYTVMAILYSLLSNESKGCQLDINLTLATTYLGSFYIMMKGFLFLLIKARLME